MSQNSKLKTLFINCLFEKNIYGFQPFGLSDYFTNAMINYSVHAQPLGHTVGWLCNFALSIDPNGLEIQSTRAEFFLCLNVNKEDTAVHGTIEIKMSLLGRETHVSELICGHLKTG